MREVVQICFAEAEVGDVVRFQAGGHFGHFATAESNNAGSIGLRFVGGLFEIPDAGWPLELLHREYPGGKTLGDVERDIDAAIVDTWLGRLSPDAGRAALKRLLMVHELGKPFDTAQGKPYKP